MADFVYVVAVIGGFFALMVGLVHGCDRIVRSEEVAPLPVSGPEGGE